MNKISLKTYQIIKLVMVVALAITFSQLFLYKNYLLAIALLVLFSLVMLWLRRQVKEIVADERDYVIGGKAALLSIQIYSWFAVIAMFVFYGLSDYNPAYKPMGIVLAFSTCILMLVYSVLFRYYSRYSFSDKKFIYTVVVLILFLFMGVFSLRVLSGEDDWMCQNGEWVKHGNPSFPAPAVSCKK